MSIPSLVGQGEADALLVQVIKQVTARDEIPLTSSGWASQPSHAFNPLSEDKSERKKTLGMGLWPKQLGVHLVLFYPQSTEHRHLKKVVCSYHCPMGLIILWGHHAL